MAFRLFSCKQAQPAKALAAATVRLSQYNDAKKIMKQKIRDAKKNEV